MKLERTPSQRFALVSCLLVSSSALADVPPQVKADLLTQQLTKAVKAKDNEAILSIAAEYEKIGVQAPPAVRWVEAKAADNTGNALRAFTALEQYFKTASRNDPRYREALALYEKVQVEGKAQVVAIEEERGRR